MVLQNKTKSQADFEKSMMNFGQSKSMFVFDDGSKALHMMYTNSHMSTVVWNDVDILNNPWASIRIQRNLKGSIVKDLTMSWIPWLKLGHCQLQGLYDCKVTGLIANFLDYASHHFNLTIIHDKDPDDDWGVTPSDGLSFDRTNASQIKGVLGGLVNKNYDIAASIWSLSPGRFKWFDFHQPMTDKTLQIYFNFQPNTANFLMYVDPLQLKVWIIISSLFTFAIIVIVVRTQTALKDGIGFQMFQLLCWFLYIFVHSVYSAALTTNFIVLSEFPFKTLQEGLALYPTWKMCMMKDISLVILVSKMISMY